MEDNAIRWWKNEREFIEYAAGVTPIGFEKRTRRQMREALKELDALAAEYLEKTGERIDEDKLLMAAWKMMDNDLAAGSLSESLKAP